MSRQCSPGQGRRRLGPDRAPRVSAVAPVRVIYRISVAYNLPANTVHASPSLQLVITGDPKKKTFPANKKSSSQLLSSNLS